MGNERVVGSDRRSVAGDEHPEAMNDDEDDEEEST